MPISPSGTGTGRTGSAADRCQPRPRPSLGARPQARLAPEPRLALGANEDGDRRGSGSVLDFGRYSGWTVGALVDHDPNYLGWLARTPIGRRLAPEINAALERRAAETAALQPKSATNGRRGLFGRTDGRSRVRSL